MVNKPGVLAKALGEFAKAKINIKALTMMDSVEHGVLRIIFEKPDKAREVLMSLNMAFSEAEVLCVILTNKPGALADIAEKLSKNHINISYAYCTAGAKGGKTTGVLKVADVKKAVKVLEAKGRVTSKKREATRRTRTTRKQ